MKSRSRDGLAAKGLLVAQDISWGHTCVLPFLLAFHFFICVLLFCLRFLFFFICVFFFLFAFSFFVWL